MVAPFENTDEQVPFFRNFARRNKDKIEKNVEVKLGDNIMLINY